MASQVSHSRGLMFSIFSAATFSRGHGSEPVDSELLAAAVVLDLNRNPPVGFIYLPYATLPLIVT